MAAFVMCWVSGPGLYQLCCQCNFIGQGTSPRQGYSLLLDKQAELNLIVHNFRHVVVFKGYLKMHVAHSPFTIVAVI